jgi:dihydroorotate dehydrogenase
MSIIYQTIIRPIIFKLDPEQAHELTLNALRLVGSLSALRWAVRWMYAAHSREEISVEAFGLKFSNPVGLAAGYDKDGLAWQGLAALGFGHIEIGTVTPRPQEGNPKPRIFRIPEENAVINRMGFPGRGSDFVLRQKTARLSDGPRLVVGINIGKNKDTPNQEAALIRKIFTSCGLPDG